MDTGQGSTLHGQKRSRLLLDRSGSIGGVEFTVLGWFPNSLCLGLFADHVLQPKRDLIHNDVLQRVQSFDYCLIPIEYKLENKSRA